MIVQHASSAQPQHPRGSRPTLRLRALIGSGDRIAAFVLPFVVVGILLNVAFPDVFGVGGPPRWLGIVAAVAFAVGVAGWAWSVGLILTKMRVGQLVTSGPYALVKHPLYTAVALLVLPSLGILLDTWLGLIITYTALNITFCVFMMESFFREIPPDLEEAAMVDGDSRFTAFRRIVLPLAAPGMAATAIFAIIVTFNEFLFALALTATPRAMTMPRGTATLIGRIDTDWASMSAAGVVGALPIVIFALLVQRHLVSGLTAGGTKS